MTIPQKALCYFMICKPIKIHTSQMEDIVNKILIIEDDKHIRNMIDKLLRQNGYDTVQAESVEQAEKYRQNGEIFDVYLIDIILPDGSGFEICRSIRHTSSAIIIFITSCDEEESITRGLDIGGDDYITKPFRAAELMSRIQANLRRMDYNEKNISDISKQKTGDYVNRDSIVINLERHEVTKAGKIINLTPIEYELISILTANRGCIVKRSTLLEKLWDSNGNFVEDSTLTVTVSRLKSKLGRDSIGRGYIETIRGYGYRWIDEMI